MQSKKMINPGMRSHWGIFTHSCVVEKRWAATDAPRCCSGLISGSLPRLPELRALYSGERWSDGGAGQSEEAEGKYAAAGGQERANQREAWADPALLPLPLPPPAVGEWSVRAGLCWEFGKLSYWAESPIKWSFSSSTWFKFISDFSCRFFLTFSHIQNI